MAAIVSVIGIVKRQNRAAAIAGLVVSVLTMLLIFGYPLLRSICK